VLNLVVAAGRFVEVVCEGWKEGRTEGNKGGVAPIEPNKQPRTKDDDDDEA
jgi:hypothetical protein